MRAGKALSTLTRSQNRLLHTLATTIPAERSTKTCVEDHIRHEQIADPLRPTHHMPNT